MMLIKQEVYMGSPLEIILTVVVLSFWFLFPIGMFLSVSHVDKNTDQIIRLGKHRHDSIKPEEKKIAQEATRQERGIRHKQLRPHYQFKRWSHHH
jgi:hypothetical protein